MKSPKGPKWKRAYVPDLRFDWHLRNMRVGQIPGRKLRDIYVAFAFALYASNLFRAGAVTFGQLLGCATKDNVREESKRGK